MIANTSRWKMLSSVTVFEAVLETLEEEDDPPADKVLDVFNMIRVCAPDSMLHMSAAMLLAKSRLPDIDGCMA